MEKEINNVNYSTELSRDMGLLHVVMIGVGAMIGAGIFVLTGLAAGEAGPALILVFLLNGIVTTFTALSYAELGSAFPEAGGGYLWIKEGLPQPNGFLSGWISWFAHSVACSLYALAFGTFLTEILLNINLPIDSIVDRHTAAKGFSVLITVLFVYINFKGAKETGKAETIITILKIIVIALFIGFGSFAMSNNPDWQIRFTQDFTPNGISGIIVAMGLTFIAFEGYEIIAQCGEEVKNPEKNIPRSIFISILIVVPIYILVALVAIGATVIPESLKGMAVWQYLGQNKELALVNSADKFMPMGAIIFLFGGLFSTMSALNATIYSSSRVLFAMGRDKNLPHALGKVHSKTQTPFIAIIISGLFIAIMAATLPIEQIASATDAMFLVLFIYVNLALINLRKHKPDLKRSFKVPLVPLIPYLGALLNLFLAIFLFYYSPHGIIISLIFIVIGIFIYVLFIKKVELKAKITPTAYQEGFNIHDIKYKILTPLANPNSVEGLITLSYILASKYNGGIITSNIVKVPPQLPLSEGKHFISSSKMLLSKATEIINKHNEDSKLSIPIIGKIKLSHNIPKAVINSIYEDNIDLLILGWRGKTKRRDFFFGNVLDDTILNATCDVIMLIQTGEQLPTNFSKIIVPITSIHNSKFSIQIAHAIGSVTNTPIQIIHVSDKTDDEIEKTRQKLQDEIDALNVNSSDIANFSLNVIKGKNIISSILLETTPDSLLIVGASEEGIFKRAFFGDVAEAIAKESTCPVLLTKKFPGKVKSWFQQLFGSRKTEHI